MKTKTDKNAHNYKNLRFIPTWKLEAILDHPHTQGIDGRDYGPVREELEQILWERKQRLQEWTLRKQMHGLDRAIKEMSPASKGPLKEKAAKVLAPIPEIPASCDEGIPEFPTLEVWAMNDGELLVIPPVILPFEEMAS
jgi:hypothetical protein